MCTEKTQEHNEARQVLMKGRVKSHVDLDSNIDSEVFVDLDPDSALNIA